jgi:rhodanese-related sulfurtransferase
MIHSTEFEQICDDAKTRVREITVAQTQAKIDAGDQFLFVDVREDNEWDKGHAAGATHIGRGILERDIHNFAAKDTEIVLYCGGGYRSALAADNLQKMGYTNVLSMAGGIKAWRDAGLPEE